MSLAHRCAAPLLYVLLAASALAYCVYRPVHNWDMIGYIAAAKSFEEKDAAALHAFTYGQLRLSVPSGEYATLAAGDNYSRAISTDASALAEQLPFYKIRPVFTGLIYLLYKGGVNIVFATHLVSGVAVVAATALLYLMSVSFLAKPWSYALPPLAVFFGVFDLARLSTPDSLAFFGVLFSAYLYLSRRFVPLLVILPLVIGIRTDLVLFTMPLSLYIFALKKTVRWKSALSVFLSVAAYIAIGEYAGNPGWSTIFSFTFVNILAHPISTPHTLTLQQYLNVLFDGLNTVEGSKTTVLSLLLSAYTLYLSRILSKPTAAFVAFNSSPAVLTIVCVFFLVSHFLAFPVLWDRFFSGTSMICAFSLLVVMTRYLAAADSAGQAAEPDRGC